jgi:hypothetical protein
VSDRRPPGHAADLPALKALVESAYRGDIGAGGWTHEADLLEGERISAEDLAAQLANPAMRVLVLPRTMARWSPPSRSPIWAMACLSGHAGRRSGASGRRHWRMLIADAKDWARAILLPIRCA